MNLSACALRGVVVVCCCFGAATTRRSSARSRARRSFGVTRVNADAVLMTVLPKIPSLSGISYTGVIAVQSTKTCSNQCPGILQS